MGCHRGKVFRTISEQKGHVGEISPHGLGSVLLLKQYGYSYRELAVQITENEMEQFFLDMVINVSRISSMQAKNSAFFGGMHQ